MNYDTGQHLERSIDKVAKLLSAAQTLSKAVLALQAVDALQMDEETRIQAIDELYKANDLYISAYMAVFPKSSLEVYTRE